jgi:transposase
MYEATTCVGIDWHQKKLVMAIVVPGLGKVEEMTIPNEVKSIKRWAQMMLARCGSSLICVYESGAGGFALHRELKKHGIQCEVAAASLIPTANGRLKTDRRDAKGLVGQLRAGTLHFVRIPTQAQEALRELTRYRQSVSEGVRSLRLQIGTMLMRHQERYLDGKKWTKRFRVWLKSVRLGEAISQEVLWDLVSQLELLEQRLNNLDRRLESFKNDDYWGATIRALCCLRGVKTVTATSLAAEIGDVRGFGKPGQLMSWVGAVPSEHSSGDRRHRGSITKAGNGRVRRLLVEASWNARTPPHSKAAVVQRRKGEPAAIVAIAQKSELRLYSRFRRLQFLGKPAPVAAVAVAREMAGAIWAILQEVERMREATVA